MDNFDLKKYLVEKKIFEVDLSEDLKDQKIKVMRQLDSIESQLEDSDLNENKEEALKQRVTQLKRLIASLEKSGDIEGLEKLLNQALTQGVGSTLKQKFINTYLNNPDELKKLGGERKIPKGGKDEDVIDFDDKTLKFAGESGDRVSKRRVFIENFFNIIKNANADQNAKFALLSLLRDNRNKIKGSEFTGDVVEGNLLDLVSPKLKKNKAFQEVAPKLLKAEGGRAIGAGEGFLLMFGENAQNSISKKNDLNISGLEFEVKASDGGAFSIDDGSGNKGKGIDKINKSTFPYLEKGKDFILNSPEYKEYMKDKDEKSILTEYFTQVYPTFDSSDISKLVNITISNPDKISRGQNGLGNLVKDIIFKYYKDEHKFDALIVVSPRTGRFVSVGGYELPPSLKSTSWALVKGSDTQAVPDGFVRLALV